LSDILDVFDLGNSWEVAVGKFNDCVSWRERQIFQSRALGSTIRFETNYW
jgi:hypothetical protein